MNAEEVIAAAAAAESAACVFAVIVASVAGVSAPFASSSLRQPSVYLTADALCPAAAGASADLVAALHIACSVVADISYRFLRCPCLEPVHVR